MSTAEEITSEIRRLVLTCRTIEAQLQQSMPKKTHQEVVTKMQAAIDDLNAELKRTKAELQKTVSFDTVIKGLSRQIASQTEAIANQSQTIEAQNKKRVDELEERIGRMADKTEYAALQKKYEELNKSMVPKEDYVALQGQFSNFVPRESFEDLQRSFAQTTVPREKLIATEARVHELEARLANSVPRSDYEELIAKIASLIGEAFDTPLPTESSSSVTATEVAPVPQPIAANNLA